MADENVRERTDRPTRVADSVGRLFCSFVDVGTEVAGGAARAFARSFEDRSQSPRDGGRSATDGPVPTMRGVGASCLRTIGRSAEDIARSVNRVCTATGDALQSDDGGKPPARPVSKSGSASAKTSKTSET